MTSSWIHAIPCLKSGKFAPWLHLICWVFMTDLTWGFQSKRKIRQLKAKLKLLRMLGNYISQYSSHGWSWKSQNSTGNRYLAGNAALLTTMPLATQCRFRSEQSTFFFIFAYRRYSLCKLHIHARVKCRLNWQFVSSCVPWLHRGDKTWRQHRPWGSMWCRQWWGKSWWGQSRAVSHCRPTSTVAILQHREWWGCVSADHQCVNAFCPWSVPDAFPWGVKGWYFD